MNKKEKNVWGRIYVSLKNFFKKLWMRGVLVERRHIKHIYIDMHTYIHHTYFTMSVQILVSGREIKL